LKVIVLYDSKRGSTEECALRLSHDLNCDAKKVRVKIDMKDYDLDNYDHIIIGTPLYMGRPLKSISHFVKQKHDLLKNKSVSFFICGIGDPDEMIESFKNHLHSDIVESSTIIKHFGGELHPDKANFIMKSIMEQMLKDPKIQATIDEDEINVFIKDIRRITKKS
jgi:menaquinone-dependent protoporphyrinogen oxidase